MAKALKIGAAVVGIAALTVFTAGAGTALLAGTSLIGAAGVGSALVAGTLGVGLGTLLAGAALLSTASALLTKAPSIPQAQSDRLNASIDPRTFRKTVLGSTAFPIDVRYEEWSGANQDYCDWIVCFASHAIDGLGQIYLNDELAWSAGATQGKYAGYFSVENLILEGTPANAFGFGTSTSLNVGEFLGGLANPTQRTSKWTVAHRLTGCAYARFRFKVTGNNKKATSPFASGVPSRITAIGRGAKLYDPRRDSTVPGGSGPMRATDQSTWRFTADDGGAIGENLPLLALRILLGWRITNPVTGAKKLATGAGLPAARLDLQSFMLAANQADELVALGVGGTEPRYRGAGVVSEGDDPSSALNALFAGCCGRLLDVGGKLSIALAHNDLAEAATDEGLLTEDVVGPFTWDPDPALDQVPNVIRGRYVDTSPASLYQLVDYPEVRLPSPDGIDRLFSLDLGYVESAAQAQRVARQVLMRKQLQRTFTAPFDIRAWGWPVGKLVPFTFAPLGFVRRPFRVTEQDHGPGGVCQMVLRAEDAAIYPVGGLDVAPVLAVAGYGYAQSYDPLVQGLDGVLADVATANDAIAAQQDAITAQQELIGQHQQALDTYNTRIRNLEGPVE